VTTVTSLEPRKHEIRYDPRGYAKRARNRSLRTSGKKNKLEGFMKEKKVVKKNWSEERRKGFRQGLGFAKKKTKRGAK